MTANQRARWPADRSVAATEESVEHRSKVHEEIKQRKPFRSTAQEAVIGLLRTSSLVRGYFDRLMAPHGLTLQQFNVLRILRGAGPDGLPTLEIGARMVERTPGVTRLIDRLVRKKMVARSRSTDDRRVVYCRLTDVGRNTLTAVDAVVGNADESAMGALTERQLENLIELLDRARSALD